MTRRRRITDFTSGPPSMPGSVLGPEDDNAVAGEIVLALEPDAAAGIAVSIPSAPLRGAGGGVTSFGSDAVDKTLGRIDVQSIARVHGMSPPDIVAGVAMAADVGLDGTFRVRYGGSQEPASVAESLNALGEVAWAEPNRFRETCAVPNDPQYGSQWGLTRINCPDAWDLTTGATTVVVAVVDTGVDLNHPELAPLLVPGQDLVDHPAGTTSETGWVFEGDLAGVDATPQDAVGHGTHVAGTISCLSDNSTGVAGVAWNVSLMPVRVLARLRNLETGAVKGSGTSANIAAGIRWAADNGANVINLSLGGYGNTLVEREAIAHAIAQGVVVVAAMGNDNTSALAYPAAYPGVIAVGATDASDQRAMFSNLGPHISVAAPGVGIQSTYWDDTYAAMSGTSMAAPHVAGVAALILSINPGLTAEQVADTLRNTAEPLSDDPGDPPPNDRYGHGLVQAGAAVRAVAPIQQSRAAVCQSLVCQVTAELTCRSRHLSCQPTIRECLPTAAVTCPSNPVICLRESVACLTLPFGGGASAPAAEWEHYDPYGYDPYGNQYD